MKKQILNFGKALNKAEQKEINGGWIPDLSQICGYYVFNSIESQCLGLSVVYKPLWNPSNNTCSVLGGGTNCVEM